MLKLNITWGGVTYDYTNTLDQTSINITEQINVPSTMTFTLTPIGVFTPPPARAYVQLLSLNSGVSLFTGFISIPPTTAWLALGPAAAQPGGQIFVYQYSATSDEYLLNLKAIPFIPAFINQTQGQILTKLANTLCSGFFDTSMVASGDLVAEFEYSPQQSWSEVAKQFADGSRYRYKVRDKKIWFQPYGDNVLGIQYNEATQPQSKLFTQNLNTSVLAVPIVNDVTIIGAAEAGNNREDYFLGDGFTGNFALQHKTFQGSVQMILQETWQNSSLNTQYWYAQDPADNFDYSAGALNVVTGPSVIPGLGFSYLAMNNGVEIAGGLQLDHGEFTFNDYCEGIIGGLYTDQTYASGGLGDIIAAFNISTGGGLTPPGPSGGVGGVIIQPMISGAVVGTPFVTEQNHNYVLQTLVTAPQYVRYTQTYRTVDGEAYGGDVTSVQGSISFRILDYDISAATGFFYEPQMTQFTVNNVQLPPFCAYALINNIQLNITDSYTTLAKMPLGTLQAIEGPSGLSTPTGLILPMLPPGSGGFIGVVPSWSGYASQNILPPPLARNGKHNLVLGNGFALQDAQYTAGQSADTLAFYAQTLPAAGTPVRLQSWESQAAVSRLQASGSIVGEAFIVGDNGIRSAIITNLNPQPRTSEDCDNAALAFLQDRIDTSYNGTYTIIDTPGNPVFVGATGDAQWFPCVGRFLHIYAPYRGIGVSGVAEPMLVTAMTVTVADMKTETIQYALSFGADLYLNKVLAAFQIVIPAEVLTSVDAANPPNPRYTINALSTYLPDLNNVYVDISVPLGPDSFNVIVGDPWSGQIEVRRLDTNWGAGHTADYIGTFTGPTFTLQRQQFDQIWYMRPVNGTQTSRRSKVLRVRYPRTPANPIFVSNINGVLQFDFNGDIRSIYGFEVRTPPLPVFSGYPGGQVVLYQCPVATYADLNPDMLQSTPLGSLKEFPYSPLDVYAYFFNADWVYSEPTVVQLTGSIFGDFPYPWSTYDPNTVTTPNEASGYRDPNFGIRQNILYDINGFATPQLVVAGFGVQNSFSQTTVTPNISLVLDPAGGSLMGGQTLTVGLWAVGQDGGATQMALETVYLPNTSNTWSITVEAEFADPANDSGWVAITPYPPAGWYGPNVTAIPVHATSYTITSIPLEYQPSSFNTPVPDARFDHYVIQARTIYVAGANGGSVAGITGGVLGFVQPTGQVFPPSGWVGRTASTYFRQDPTQPLQIIDVPILSVTDNTIEIDPTSAALLVTGDGVLVRLRADQFGPSLIGDSTLAYWYNTTDKTNPIYGLTPHLYAGKAIFITKGTGWGSPLIAIADNDATSFTPATPFPVTPDSTTEFIVVNSIIDYEFDTTSTAYFSDDVALEMTVSVDNAFRHFLVQVLTADTAGDQSIQQYSPYRMIFSPGFGQGAGATGFGNPQETFIVGFGPGGSPADIPATGSSNLAIEKVAGTLFGWDAIAEFAPSGADLIFDILKYRGNGPGVSVFKMGGPWITIPDGSTLLETGNSFDPNNSDIQKDDRLQLQVLQVGSDSPGQRATVNLYWGNVASSAPTPVSQ